MSFGMYTGLSIVLLLVTGTVCEPEKTQGKELNGEEKPVSDFNNYDRTLTTVREEEAVQDELDDAAIEQEGPSSEDTDQDTDFHREKTDQTEAEMKLKQYQALVEWIEEQGGYMKHCSFQHIPGAGVGVVAAEGIEENTTISLTPLSAMITTQIRLLPMSVSPALKTKFLSGALILASEKYRGDSIWQSYIDILHDQELGLPLLFTDEEINELEGSELKVSAENERKKYFEQIDNLIRDIKQARPKQFVYLNRSMLIQAVAVWKSRAFSIKVPDNMTGRKASTALVPLADMYNTAVAVGERNTKCGYNNDPYSFACWTTRDVKQGEEILVEYRYDPARRTNSDFLFSYGFVIKDNPNDAVWLQLPEMTTDDSHHSTRVEAASDLDFMKEKHYRLNRTTHEGYGTVNELIRFMRISEGTEEEIQREMESEYPFQQPLSKETELKVLRAAADYLQDTLNKYPTSVEEDSALLDRSDGLSRNVRNAVLLRYEGKHILQMNIDHLERMYKLLVGEANSKTL